MAKRNRGKIQKLDRVYYSQYYRGSHYRAGSSTYPIEAVPPITDKRDMVGMTYMLFSIPFGYTIWNDLLTPKYETIWNKVFGTWCTKVAFSLISGWIILPFVLIRFIVRKIRPNNHKQKEKEGKYEK